MSEETSVRIGHISWVDLTVEDADATRNFYREVVGWQPVDVNMGDYNDYCMNEPQSGKTVAGICHARGANAALPPAWLVYITVEDLDKSLAKCIELGGEQLVPIRSYGEQARYCVIRDPAGAVCALFQPK